MSTLTIDLSRVRENLWRLQQCCPKERQLVMLKADGYGCGALPLAQFLEREGTEIFGLAYVSEALHLRRAGIKTPLFILYASPDEVSSVVEEGFELGIDAPSDIATLGECARALRKKTKVHLHIDTGMGRFGCLPKDAELLARQILDEPWLEFEGVMTHLSSADSDPIYTKMQLSLFDQALLSLPKIPPNIHVANTTAAVQKLYPKATMHRVGIGLFGFVPGFQPALSLTSRIVRCQNLPQGSGVSYGATWRTPHIEGRVGVVPLGYADGLNKAYSNCGHFLVNGQPLPLIGAICMDFMMLDLHNAPDTKEGDSVLLFGLSSEGAFHCPLALANTWKIPVHQLIAPLGPRIRRIYLQYHS